MFQKSSYKKNRSITQWGPKSIKLLYSIMNVKHNMLALVSKANKNQELGFGSSDQDLIMVLKITGTKTSELFIVYNFTSIWDQRVQYCLQFYIHLGSESSLLFTILHPFGIREFIIVYNFTSIWVQRVHYCLQFYIHLGSESPLDKRQITEDRLSSGTGSMPQTWPGRLCSQSA